MRKHVLSVGFFLLALVGICSVPAAETPAATTPPPQTVCENGQCVQLGKRLYSAREEVREYSRRRLFGGRVIRQHRRTVLRPVR